MELPLSAHDSELCVLVSEAGDHCICIVICVGVSSGSCRDEMEEVLQRVHSSRN